MTETTIIEPISSRPRKMAREPRADATADAGTAGAHVEKQLNTVATKPQTKAAQVQTLLAREGGASLGELCQATGWLPHTARAFLTGLRKKGHAIERSKVDGERRYTIAVTCAQ